ncbi:hypothetical protein B0H10DRAFT_2231863 [Mycena sp. CBHHK59/15]|nr:hypothetical protein B0H10DRAFT_2231863 [Mycena sp. CBHHK59/15]
MHPHGDSDTAVGKSSLLVRLTTSACSQTPIPPCVPASPPSLTFPPLLTPPPQSLAPNSSPCPHSHWHRRTSHQRLSFYSITGSYFRSAAGCLVYDVTFCRSFENVHGWLSAVRAHANAHVSCMLVGNKADLCYDGSSFPHPMACLALIVHLPSHAFSVVADQTSPPPRTAMPAHASVYFSSYHLPAIDPTALRAHGITHVISVLPG